MSTLDLAQRIRLTWGPNQHGREEQAFGRPKENAWTVHETSLGGLVKAFILDPWERGSKEGRCFLSGALARDGVARTADAMAVNYLIGFDVDKGGDIDAVSARLKGLGLAHIIYETHSSGRRHTDVKERELEAFRRDGGHVCDEAESVKILIGRSDVSSVEHTRDGEGKPVWRAQHRGRAERFRVLLFLAVPWVFGPESGMSQKECVAAWKRFYVAVGTWLGFKFDGKCQDPSRLFFPPRIARDADETQFRRFYVEGRALTVEEVPKPAVAALRTPRDATLVDDVVRPDDFATKDLKTFLAKHGKTFRPVDLVRAKVPDGERNDKNDGKTEVFCPFGDLHSKETARFPAYVVQDDDGWHFGCVHETCQAHATPPGEEKADRARYLDAWCQQYGISDAKDLEVFCPPAEDVKATINALPDGLPDDATRARIVGLIASADPMLRDHLINAFKKKTGIAKGAIAIMVHAARAGPRERAPRGKPAPENGADCDEILEAWGYKERARVLLQRFAAVNAGAPKVFYGPGGIATRINKSSGQSALEPLTERPQWVAALRDVVAFRNRRGHVIEPPGDMTNLFIGGAELGFPNVRAVARVPIFGDDGKLRTVAGYDASTETWLDPSGEFMGVGVPTDEEAAEALAILNEAVCDFPFSDGPDRGGEGSKAHLFAMVIQPFVGDLIDGPRPFFLVTKPQAATGASLLVETVCGGIWTGDKLSHFDINEKSEAEIAKEITARLMRGDDALFFDNLQDARDSGMLCSFITSGKWDSRILGVSKNFQIDFRGVGVLAGNNPTFSAQMARRFVPIRLNADMPNPQFGRTFTHSPLGPWIKDNRERLVWACHVLIARWIAAGRPSWKPPTGVERLASFEAWSDVMGGILDVAGVPGFLSTVREFQEDQPEAEGDVWTAVVGVLWKAYGKNEFSAREALKYVWCPPDEVDVDMVEAGYSGERQGRAVQMFGTDLGKNLDRRFLIEDTDGQPLYVRLVRGRKGQPTKYKIEARPTSPSR